MNRDLAHLVRSEAAGRNRWSAQSDPAGAHRRLRIEGDGVLIDGDVDRSQRRLGVVAGYPKGTHIHQHQVVVSAAGDEAEAFLRQCGGQRLSIV